MNRRSPFITPTAIRNKQSHPQASNTKKTLAEYPIVTGCSSITLWWNASPSTT